MNSFELVVQQGRAEGQLFILPAGTLIVGNATVADLKIPDEPNSSLSALLIAKGAGVSVRNLGGSSQLLVNGSPVLDWALMYDNFQLTVGTTVFRLRLRKPKRKGSPEADFFRIVSCDNHDKCKGSSLVPNNPTFSSACVLCDNCAVLRLPADDSGNTLERFGSFDVLKKIAEGGMGAVYEAVQRGTGIHAAVKVILPSLLDSPNSKRQWLAQKVLDRFLRREQQVAQALCHPNIVSHYEIGAERRSGAPVFYIATEFVHGETLVDYMGRLPDLQSALSVAVDLFHALEYMHSMGYVHRDIKPSNLLVTHATSDSPPRGKLTDFGLAKFLGDTKARAITEQGESWGTRSFMSPEQQKDFRGVGPSADIYSAAAVVYWMLSGNVPVEPSGREDNDTDEMQKFIARLLLSERRPIKVVASDQYPDLPYSIADLIDSLVAAKPAAREAMSAAEIAHAIKNEFLRHG